MASCGAVLEPQVSIDAHLAVTPIELLDATLSFCRNGECAQGTVAGSDAGTAATSVALSGALTGVYAYIDDEHDGYLQVQFSLGIGGIAVADGDTYAVGVVAADGTTLLQVSRPVTYDEVETCQSFSKQVRLELYPTSASGIQCGNQYCAAGVAVKGTLQTSDRSTALDVTLCRDGTVCSTGTASLVDLTAPNIQVFGDLSGGFLANVMLQESGGGFAYEVDTLEDSAALQDGDRYALTIAQGGNTLVSGAATATYTATYLNGTRCDPVPCRKATLTLR